MVFLLYIFYNKYMFSDPKKIIDQLAIMPGAAVADLGAGLGAYTVLLSKKVGPTGKVYACDVQKDILARLDREIHDQGITNVQTVLTNIENHQGTKLRDQSIDWVIIANTLFQVEDRPALIKEMIRIVKPEGKILIVDWSESFGNLGPRQSEIVTQQWIQEACAPYGFTKTAQVIEAGAHHYGIILNRSL